MAFRLRSPEEKAALDARTPRQKEVDSAKERFLRTVKGFATDQDARRRGSTSLLVITLGDYPQTMYNAQVKDWDGRVRASSSISMPYREDGGSITHENASEMRVARYWSSRTDREEHRDENGLDPRIGIAEMQRGAKVTLVGHEKVIPGRDGRPDDVMFVATRARAGEHSWNDMMTVERDSLEDFVDRYVSMKPESYRDGVADMYAEKYVEREEAKASERGRTIDTGARGPSDEAAPAFSPVRSQAER
jgi:hypothetical protein